MDVAETGVRALAAGRDVPVHDVMIALEQARLDLSLATEVRNRLVEAYQELARIQL
ncbi:flagellar hook-basal body complex protein FliE [Listeria seeligeri]|uniref:flagellar hook-basal body complex protein FliE n=1 Tax=Listeria seeligeri TaxID=1640 RepID=UPI0024DF51DA|nr:flagellar hook-basal body complex protein FliE [Listeria seeligeri]MBT0178077.1 flagellar hook-basal body complex protein FliE [Listeria seeligeri]